MLFSKYGHCGVLDSADVLAGQKSMPHLIYFDAEPSVTQGTLDPQGS